MGANSLHGWLCSSTLLAILDKVRSKPKFFDAVELRVQHLEKKSGAKHPYPDHTLKLVWNLATLRTPL